MGGAEETFKIWYQSSTSTERILGTAIALFGICFIISITQGGSELAARHARVLNPASHTFTTDNRRGRTWQSAAPPANNTSRIQDHREIERRAGRSLSTDRPSGQSQRPREFSVASRQNAARYYSAMRWTLDARIACGNNRDNDRNG